MLTHKRTVTVSIVLFALCWSCRCEVYNISLFLCAFYACGIFHFCIFCFVTKALSLCLMQPLHHHHFSTSSDTLVSTQKQHVHRQCSIVWIVLISVHHGSVCECVCNVPCVCLHVYSASAFQLPHCLQTVSSHHGGWPSLCEGQKRRVPPVGDNSDLWGPVTAAAGKHALWGSACNLTAILYT